MKIHDRIINYVISKLAKSTPNATENIEQEQLPGGQKVEKKGGSGQDTSDNLSQALKEAQKIEEIILSEPDVREDKVAALKEKIESGTYKIDHKRVADKLVDAFLDEIF